MSNTQTDSQNLNDLITSAVQDANKNGLGDGGVWRAACDAVVNHRLSQGQPFTSGEVAAILRTFDCTLNFAVGSVGERLRDGFYAGEFQFTVEAPEQTDDGFGNPELDDNGNILYVTADGSDVTSDPSEARVVTATTPAEQVTRYTEGLVGRTPANVAVFCYAPTYAEGEAHDFEVDIPRPNIPAAINPTTGVPDAPVAAISTRDPAGDDTQRAVQVAKAAAKGDLTCTVQSTGRMNIGRSVLENLALVSRQSLLPDTKVFVWVNGDTLTCRLEDDASDPATVAYKVFRGRTLVNLAKLGLARPQGTAVTAEIDSDGITIAL